MRYGKGAVPIGFPCRCRGIPCIVVKELSRLDFSANVRLFFIHVRVYLFLEVHMNRREFHILFMVFFCSFPCQYKSFYIAICFNQIYANALRGAGNSTAPMVIMMGSFIVFRQIYLFIISKCFNTITSVALGYPLGWILCSVLLFIYYHKVGLHSKKKI